MNEQNRQSLTQRSTEPGQCGFTLIELMVVVAVLGIIAGIAVPSLVQSRAAANEGAVIGTMRAISTGQFKFKSMALVDVDGNGGYEFATLSEMTGGAALRGSGGERLSPNLLPMSLDRVDTNGRFLRYGYYFQLYLPDAGGVGLPEIAGNTASIDPNNSAEYWTLVAWPAQKGQTGRSTFFVNQQGEILKSADLGYSGLTNMPPAGPALLGTGDENRIDSAALAIGTTGADGSVWTPVR